MLLSPFLSVTTEKLARRCLFHPTAERISATYARLPSKYLPFSCPDESWLAVTRFHTRARLAQPRDSHRVLSTGGKNFRHSKSLLLHYSLFLPLFLSLHGGSRLVVKFLCTLDVRSEEARLMDQFILSINDFGSRVHPRNEELISHSRNLEAEIRLTIIFVNSNHSPTERLLNILSLIMNGFCNQRQLQSSMLSGSPR